MYHIQKDKRAQKSAALILQALRQCMQETSYEDVTITDICQTSTVSRATFYRLFDRKDDVVSWGLDLFFDCFYDNTVGCTPREKLESYFAVWMANPHMLDLIVVLHREELPEESYRRRVDLLQRHFGGMIFTDHHVTLLSALMTSLLTQWAHTGKRETPAQLAEVFLAVLRDLNAGFAGE